MYKLDEKDLAAITEGLRIKQDDGRTKADILFGSNGNCPICLTEAEKNYQPYIVDKAHLQFRTSCCGVMGGAVSFIILSGKIPKGADSVKRAVNWLQNFIRG